MQLNLKYFLSFLLFFTAVQLQAQVQFEIVVSAKEIGKRDQLQVEYIVSGGEKISNFQLPYFAQWNVMSGPSSSSEMYNINGKRSSLFKYIYVVAPTATGKLNIPGTSVNVDGKDISCKGLLITVKKQDHVDGAGPVPYSPPQVDLSVEEGAGAEDFKEYDLKPGEDPIRKIRNNLFVKATTSKARCYVGEPILVTYKLYTRLRSTSRVVKQPTFNGCSVNEMTTSDMRAVVETVNGKKYNSYVFRKVQLFPLQPGRITATAASVDNTVTFLSGERDPRKLFYGIDEGKDYDLTLSTDPFNIEVMPLPGNKVATVGNFEVFARFKKDTIAANETNALIVTVVGSGNFKSVAEPEILWPENIYHFDAKETDEIDKLSFPLTGRKTFEIPFEVSGAGTIDFSPVSFSYFDPSKGNFKTVKTGTLHLSVTPALKASIQESSVLNTENSGSRISLLLFVLPVIFVVGGLLIWKRSKQKVMPEVSDVPETTEGITPAIEHNIKDKVEELVFIQDDTMFYSKAREIAKDLVATGKGDTDLLLQVLQDCNTVLYTPMPATSRKEIWEKLRRAVA